MALAYKDIPVDDWDNFKYNHNNFSTNDDRDALENNSTFIGLFALTDPLRDKVKRSVQFAHVGRINVRLISGDNLDTAIQYAI
jgi:P-type E1-E2 ATPase